MDFHHLPSIFKLICFPPYPSYTQWHIYIYTYRHIHVYIYTDTYTYIHTYIYILQHITAIIFHNSPHPFDPAPNAVRPCRSRFPNGASSHSSSAQRDALPAAAATWRAVSPWLSAVLGRVKAKWRMVNSGKSPFNYGKSTITMENHNF